MQKRKHSLLETVISTAIGFGAAYVSNLAILPHFGFDVTYAQSFWITCWFTLISLIRGYGVRRLFNWLHLKEIL